MQSRCVKYRTADGTVGLCLWCAPQSEVAAVIDNLERVSNVTILARLCRSCIERNHADSLRGNPAWELPVALTGSYLVCH